MIRLRLRTPSDPEPIRLNCHRCGERYLLENLEDCVSCNNDICPSCGTWAKNTETNEEHYICDLCWQYRDGWWKTK